MRDANAKRRAIAARANADTLARLAAWGLCLAVEFGLVAPIVVACWRDVGAITALVIGALLGGAAWQIAPQGRGYARTVRDIAAEYPRDD